MAKPKRNETSMIPVIPFSQADGYRPGGPVGQMQADLARRLAHDGIVVRDPANAPSGERIERLVSVAAGCTALLAAYAGVVFLILR